MAYVRNTLAHQDEKRCRTHRPEFLVLLGSSFVEPARLAVSTLGRLDAAVAGIGEQFDHAHIVRIAIAATYADRLAGCRAALEKVVEHGRAGGTITSAIEAFVLLGYDCAMTGEWDRVQPMTDEGLTLTRRYGYLLLGGLLQFQRAYVAAARGDEEIVNALTDEMTRWAAPNRVGLVLHYAAHAKTLTALGRGDFEAAYRHAAAVCTPTPFRATHPTPCG
ncbi:hypothetical protein [Nocardia sp. NPDC004604]|uniref:hypothetical protein n=1 Tax=Nocardia sp. NPDC004604 TaxID=3157013 RepID=UPI0033A82F15